MNLIEKEISRSMQINQRLADMRQREYQQNHKNDLLMAYFDIIFEHHEAVCLLIKEKLVGSGFVLVRPITETFLRAAWVNACSTAQQQSQLLVDDNFKFPNMNAMVKEIGAAYSAETFFQMIKDNTWKSACSYAHSGLLQISRRFDEDGNVAPYYTEAEILEVLRQTTTVLLLAGILFFKSTGYHKEALEIENNWLSPPILTNLAI